MEADAAIDKPSPLETLKRALDQGTARQVHRLVNSMHPAEVASLLESLPPPQRDIVWDCVDPEFEGDVLVELNEEVRGRGAHRRRRDRLPVRAGEPLLRAPVRPADVVWSYSGVRPLLEDEAGDPAAVTRDYLLELDTAARAVAVRLGRQDHHLPQARRGGRRRLAPRSASRRGWTARAFLPGGDLSAWIGAPAGPTRTSSASSASWGAATASCRCLWRGAWRVPTAPRRALLGGAGRAALGAEVAPGLLEAELRLPAARGVGGRAEDVLWRRTKLGLHFRRRARRWPTGAGGAAATAGDGARQGGDLMQLSSTGQPQSGAPPTCTRSTSPRARAVTVLLGATQAGKTSLMRVMAGLDGRPRAASVEGAT